MNTDIKKSQWRRLIPSANVVRALLKISAMIASVFLGLALLMTVIFWDADFYVPRERWETFKHAMFGEWDGVTGQVKSPNDEPALDPHQLVNSLFSGYDEVHLFTRKAIEGSSMEVMTGARFKQITDILDGKAAHQWCNVSNHESNVSHRIDLSEKYRSFDPDSSVFEKTPEEELSLIGIDKNKLRQLIKTHCQFDFFVGMGGKKQQEEQSQ